MNLGLGQTIGGRYKIISQLGQGGFGKTFVAQDQHLPDNQHCVVKQLKPQATDPLTLETARRLFETEAKMLHKLGTHDQIPQLFAYFEENQEFFLVQEFIEGDDLSKEITPGKKLSEQQVISLLKDILQILEFVHQRHVIHRDINPRNIIRRKQDEKLILIDFGAVKQVSTQVIQGGKTRFTVAIGTPGYQPGEQANGNPKLSSDIYAVGMVGIQALTGILPDQLPTDPETSEIAWHKHASVSPALSNVLDKMVRYDFRERYSSANLALQALQDLTLSSGATIALSPAISSKGLATKLKFLKLTPQRVLISISVLGVGIVGAVLAMNLLKSANATDLYNRGETFIELKRFDDALVSYNRAVEIRPDYTEAWSGKGDTLVELKQYEEALNAYDKAIQLQPNYLEAWNGRGKALDRLQRYDEAVNAFDSALKIQPNNLEAWNERGNVLITLKQYSDAIASFDKALNLQPDYAPAWYRRGLALHSLRRYDDAVKSYDKAIESNPDSAQSWYARGNALVNLERYPDAVESYEKAVQFQPKFYQAWYSRGSALSNTGQYEKAITAFDQAVKYKSDYYEAWYGRGWALHQLNRYEDAVTAYNKAIKLRPSSYLASYNLGNSFYNLKRYGDAIASYNKAVEHKPDHYESWYSRGNALVNLQRYAEAIQSYDKALRYAPDYRQASDARKQAQNLLEAQRQKQQAEKEKQPDEKESVEPTPDDKQRKQQKN